jgi:hypothetical protein
MTLCWHQCRSHLRCPHDKHVGITEDMELQDIDREVTNAMTPIPNLINGPVNLFQVILMRDNGQTQTNADIPFLGKESTI